MNSAVCWLFISKPSCCSNLAKETRALLDGAFTVAFEDQPLDDGDRDFNDALFRVELLDAGAAGLPTAGATPSGSMPADASPGETSFPTARVEPLITAQDVVAV